MVKNPESMYEFKRSKNLLKIKKFIDDEVIVDSELGNGKNKNVIGMMSKTDGNRIKSIRKKCLIILDSLID